MAIILAQLGEHRRLGGESAVATIATGSRARGLAPQAFVAAWYEFVRGRYLS
jgi:hypothetical protein